MKHLVKQEQLLKDELKQTKRKNELADNLNVEYLKNVVVSFLIKVRGPTTGRVHVTDECSEGSRAFMMLFASFLIRCTATRRTKSTSSWRACCRSSSTSARRTSPRWTSRSSTYYTSSWWHRTANLLKPAEPSTLWGQMFGT